jgi:hypothetical protein
MDQKAHPPSAQAGGPRIEIKKKQAEASGGEVDVKAASSTMLRQLDDFSKLMAEGTVDERRSVVRAFVDRVEIDRSRREARFFFLQLPDSRKRISGPKAGDLINRDGCGGPRFLNTDRFVRELPVQFIK